MGPWQYLPNPWRQYIQGLPRDRFATLEEIRFRANRPVHLYGTGWTGPVGPEPVNPMELERVLGALVDHSLYAREEELRQGFITLPGGHRVGVAGRAVLHHGRVTTVRQVTGLNLRVARATPGAAAALVKTLEAGGQHTVGSVLLVAPPRAGKTTLLRDLVRILSDQGRRIVAIDERSEVAGLGGAGAFGFDVGEHTDVLDGWPKPEGIEVALRTLGPDVIAVDELGGDDDLQAVRRARFSGVDVLATAHARSREELEQRAHYRDFLWSGGFDAVVTLAAGPIPGRIVDVWTGLSR